MKAANRNTARQHGQACDRRNRPARPGADGLARNLDGVGRHLRLPVAALQHLRGRLRADRGRDDGELHRHDRRRRDPLSPSWSRRQTRSARQRRARPPPRSSRSADRDLDGRPGDRPAVQVRPGADHVERRAAGARERARGRHELAGRQLRDRRRQLGFQRRQLGPVEGRRDLAVHALQERIDDLDVLGAGPEARERVDQALKAGSRSRRPPPASARRGRSSCSRRRAPVRPRDGGGRAGRAGGRRRARRRTAARAGLRPVRRSGGQAASRRYDRTNAAIRSSSSSVIDGYQVRTTADVRAGAGRLRSTSSSSRCTASPISVAASPPSPPGSGRCSRSPATRST